MSEDQSNVEMEGTENTNASEEAKASAPVTPENLKASQEAKEAEEKWKKENPLSDRMAKIAEKAAGGTSTGKGIAGLGAQIAAAVKGSKGENDQTKLSVNQVVKEV